jgi:two-component system, cell cycle response regulator
VIPGDYVHQRFWNVWGNLNSTTNILVVDDEQAHTLLISELLKKSGYNCNVANDGFKAIAACKVRTPDLIILDLHMPMMGGVEVLTRLRAEEKTKDIPLIFLGNKDHATPGFPTSEQSEEDVLIKPFEPNELLSRIKSVLKQKALSEKLKEREGQIKDLALVDSVTALKTPRFLNEFLRTQIKQSRRYKLPLSVIVTEIDQAHVIEGQRSKKFADELMAELSKFVSEQLRDSDICARTDPFEITLILTMTDKKGAIEVAERMRNKVRQTSFTAGGEPVAVTVSLGLCQFAENMDENGETLLSHARAALTQAHESGGDVTLMAE